MTQRITQLPDDFRLIERLPTITEYRALRTAVGWSNLPDEATRRGLDNASFTVCLERHGDTIGCGRVVGDGGIYFYIQDIIVHPDFQGRGLGRRIMDAVMQYLSDHAAPNAFMGLMAATGVCEFYERYGFAVRPDDRPGMFRVWPAER